MTNPDPLPGDEDLEEEMSEIIVQGYSYTDWECPKCLKSNTEVDVFTGAASCAHCEAQVWVSDNALSSALKARGEQ